MTNMHELYATGVSLARQLGLPVEEVPQPFQLNELEDYVAQHKLLADRQAEEETDPFVLEPETEDDGPTVKR